MLLLYLLPPVISPPSPPSLPEEQKVDGAMAEVRKGNTMDQLCHTPSSPSIQ